MTVSKTLRGYIETQVEQAIPHEEKYYLDLMNEQTKKVQSWTEGKLKAIAEEAEQLFGEWYETSGSKRKFDSNGRPVFDARLKSAIKYREVKKQREEEINGKVSEIVAILELGGNKADLDRMLAEIRAE